jgi:hypothetical protein
MDETDKLRVLIPHWIDHNNEHAAEFRGWALTWSHDQGEHDHDKPR